MALQSRWSDGVQLDADVPADVVDVSADSDADTVSVTATDTSHSDVELKVRTVPRAVAVHVL